MTATAIETLNGRNRDFASHRHVSSLKMMPRPASVGRARHRRVAREPGSLGRRGRDRSRLRRRNRTGRDRGRAVAAATRDRCGRGAPLAGGPSMREAPVDARHEAWSATGCTPQKLKARPLNLLEGTGPSGWLRGQDLNLRPSGCEGDFTQPADGRRHSCLQFFRAVGEAGSRRGSTLRLTSALEFGQDLVKSWPQNADDRATRCYSQRMKASPARRHSGRRGPPARQPPAPRKISRSKAPRLKKKLPLVRPGAPLTTPEKRMNAALDRLMSLGPEHWDWTD